jgi:hypothetical protein
MAPEQPPEYMQGTPQGLLHDYLEGDFEGERLERATWPTKYKNMVSWENEPLWDTCYIINRYVIQSGNTTLQRAQAAVTYETMGEMSLESYEYRPSPSRQTVPFTLELSKTGWRISYPMLKPHVSPEAAIAFLQRMEVGYPQLRSRIQRSIDTIKAQMNSLAPQVAPTP